MKMFRLCKAGRGFLNQMKTFKLHSFSGNASAESSNRSIRNFSAFAKGVTPHQIQLPYFKQMA